MLSGVSGPPQANGLGWSILQPGQDGLFSPVDGQAFIFAKSDFAL
jgi:hypothetical protein